MASVVLGVVGGAVGTAIGGPGLGYALASAGSMLGGLIDNSLFAVKAHSVVGRLTDTMITGAAYGQPIIQAYGLVRGGCQMIYSSQMREIDVSEGGGGGGGKGGGGNSGGGVQQATYYVDFAMAICQGPIKDLLRVWGNGEVLWDNRKVSYDGTTIGAPGNGGTGNNTVVWYPGSETQLPDPTIEGNMGTGYAPAYRGTAYIVVPNLNITNFGNSIPNITVEYVANIGNRSYDATNAISMLSADVVTSDICSKAGLAASQIDVSSIPNFTPAGYIITSQTTYRGALSSLQQCYFYDGIESNYKLNFVPQTGSSIATLSETFLGARAESIQEDVPKVTITRTQDMDLPRSVIVRYLLPNITYQIATEESQRPKTCTNSNSLYSFDVPIVMEPADAATIASQALYLAWIGRRKYSFKIPRPGLVFDPGDVVTLQYHDSSSNYIAVPVYIQQTDYGANDIIEVTAIAADEPLYVPTKPPSAPPLVGVSMPSTPDTTTTFVYVPPLALTNVAQVWVGAASDDPNWGGTQVWLSFDSLTWSLATTITAAATLGTLTASYPSHASPDTVSTLSVSLAESLGYISTVTTDVASSYGTLSYVDGELEAYSNVVQTGSYAFSCTAYTLRGLYGTTITSHASGSVFCLLNSAIQKITIPSNYQGSNVYIQFLSFNAQGRNLQALGTVPVQQLTLGTAAIPIPAAPSSPTLTASGATLTLAWTASAGPNLSSYAVQFSTDGTTWPISLTVPGSSNSTTYSGAAGLTYTGRVAAVNTSGGESAFVVSNSVALSGATYTLQLRGGTAGTLTNGQTIFEIPMVGGDAFPSAFSGSEAHVDVAPTSLATFTFTQNGSTIGTLVFSAGSSTPVYATSSGAISFSSNDIFKLTAPASADATLSGISFTLRGTRTS